MNKVPFLFATAAFFYLQTRGRRKAAFATRPAPRDGPLARVRRGRGAAG